MNIVGIDKDGISEDEAKHLKKKIECEKKCQVILYKTKNGFHLELLFSDELSVEDRFKIRKKYGDCSERLRISKLNSRAKSSKDILFTVKNNHLRHRI